MIYATLDNLSPFWIFKKLCGRIIYFKMLN
jgi:hypothetical protein